jgi:hypothetical protein
MPTFVVFKNGKEIRKVVGADAARLEVSLLHGQPLLVN